MDKIWAYIPARKNSKSIKDKNIQEILGVSLFALSIRYANALGICERISVDTDSSDYLDIAKNEGADCSYFRDETLSGDDIGDLDIIKAFLNFHKEKGENLPKYLLHLRPTTPLRKLEHLEELKNAMKKDNWTSIRSVHPLGESCYKNAEIDNESGFLKCVFSGEKNLDLINLPKQSFPKTYVTNGYIDILSVEHILENDLVHGERTLPLLTEEVIEIDSSFELELARKEASIKKDQYLHLFK